MPFQSEKQRRYLWANEPEIARDWTDTYGSGIAKALGGRIGFRRGTSGAPGGGDPGMSSSSSAAGQTHSGGGGEWSPGVGGTQHIPTPSSTSLGGGDRIIDIAQRNKRQDMRDLLARQQAEKEYTRQGVRKVGPQLSLAGSGIGGGGIKNFLGNWGSTVGGSQLGGGLGSMLFGPWGMLLGSIFGGGVGRRGWKASQTPEKETMQDILFGQNTLLSNLINKKKTPTTTGEGLGGIDLSDMRDKRSAKDYIDLSKSYSEFDTIPNPKYHGLNIGRNYMNQGIGSDSIKRAGGLKNYDVTTSLEKNPELHQQMNDAATKAQNEYAAKIQSGEIPFPDNFQLEMDKVGNDARHNIMQSQSDAPDIFSETLQEGLDKSNVQGKQKLSREQELLKEMGI